MRSQSPRSLSDHWTLFWISTDRQRVRAANPSRRRTLRCEGHGAADRYRRYRGRLGPLSRIRAKNLESVPAHPGHAALAAVTRARGVLLVVDTTARCMTCGRLRPHQ